MTNRPRNIGTAAETAVVRYLQTHGFPNAERRSLRGILDAGDITGTPGICWEIKAGAAAKTASDGLVAQWLAETEQERVNARADVGVLVLARKGVGAVNAGRWWAVLRLEATDMLAIGYPPNFVTDAPLIPVRIHLSDTVTWLRHSGYGDPLPTPGPRPVTDVDTGGGGFV
jgi:hypothetical protein